MCIRDRPNSPERCDNVKTDRESLRLFMGNFILFLLHGTTVQPPLTETLLTEISYNRNDRPKIKKSRFLLRRKFFLDLPFLNYVMLSYF